MKISYNWLKQFLNIDLPENQIEEMLTGLGLEVEGVTTVESIKGSLKGIVVGEVLNCEKHPNADRLKLTTVNIGYKEPLQIVCGAPNVAAGQKVPVAPVGTVLYDGKGDEFKIKKTKIRGELSAGMICAEDELGLGTDHDGIMVLNPKTKVGKPMADLYDISTETVFEIGLTPNRADAMSHLGVARDLKAKLTSQGDITELIIPSVSNFRVDTHFSQITVKVEDHEQVPRYAGVVIKNIKVEDSPQWIKDRLQAVGVKTINNVVDITNYVLHELGQPLHAFDLSKIENNTVVVKNLSDNTAFTTLDGENIKLHKEDIMICDGADNPMCIGGVYGGKDSGVTDRTTGIFLESAYFDPVSIRKTAKRHGFNTDASFRFERGIDPNITIYALKRAALLIEEIAGGRVAADIVDIYPHKIEDTQLMFNYDKAFKLIGQELDTETISTILLALDIKINSHTKAGLGLTVPPYRVDVTREADVVEEILRVYGYNNIKSAKKLHSSLSYSEKKDAHKLESLISGQLISLGFFETMANSLTNVKYNDLIDDDASIVQLLNPLSSDLSVMRNTLLYSSLECVSYNLNRQQTGLRFFEFGNIYSKDKKGYAQEKRLGITVSGIRNEENWLAKTTPYHFFYLKSVALSVLEKLGLDAVSSRPTENPLFSEGLSFYYKKKLLLGLGVVDPGLAKKFGIKQEVLFADFNWDEIIKNYEEKTFKVSPLPKYPSVKRDFALLLDKQITFKDIYDLSFKTDNKYLRKVDLFDVYTGDKLPEDKKSYAVSFQLQDDSKTLSDKEIDNTMKKLQGAFEKELKASLRG